MLSLDTLKDQYEEPLSPTMSQLLAYNAGDGLDDFKNSGYDSGPFDMEAYIASYSWSFKNCTVSVEGTKRWKLETCPFDPNHGADSFLSVSATGAPGFKCFHNGCAGKRIKDLFARFPVQRAAALITSNESAEITYTQQFASQFKFTDVGNAELFVQQFGHLVRFVPAFNQWFLWTEADGRWVPDDLLASTSLGFAFTKRMIKAAMELTQSEPDRAKLLFKHAVRTQQRPRLEAMLHFARSLVAIKPEALDSDKYLLNCLNGTINLRTGVLQKHNRDDLITKQVSVKYDADAVSEEWDNFLGAIMCGNQDLVRFLARAVGYTLTGDTGEEVFFFLHGKSGRNGKGTLRDAISTIMGDYGRGTDFATFQQASFSRGGSAPTPDIARLAGARFVHAAEADAGTKLNAGLVKTLTGGDPITARGLRQAPFTFRPQFKLWLQANTAPVLNDEDDAIWSRVIRIPFDHRFERPGPRVKTRLSDPQLSGPAILAWAVRGCLEWQERGLDVPDIVKKSVTEYKADMDPLAGFYETRCKFGPNECVGSAEMYHAYLNWCDRPPRVPERDRLSRKMLSTRLTKFRNCCSKQLSDGKWGLAGVSLQTEDTPF